MIAMGGYCISNSCDLGVLNGYPEALKNITSNACLSTSSFLAPALQVAMAELRPLIMHQVAVRLTAVSLRMIAELLPDERALTPPGDICEDKDHKLLESVHHALDQAIPYFQWQGPRNYCGRVQYVAALLEEGIRVLQVPQEASANA